MIQGIVTDIEGTTSSINFVHEVLFPYSRKHISEFLEKHGREEDIAPLMQSIWRDDLGERAESADLKAVCAKLIEWIDQDRKHPTLKSLQGKIWKRGYEQGAFKGHVYPEVRGCLDQWKKRGLNLSVYSSGSVEAQKLLFTHSEAGDLTPYFSAYFDTRVGMKQQESSYTRIAAELKAEASSLLFLSDITLELDAAQKAGFQCCQLVRDVKVQKGNHVIASNFNEVEKIFLS